jgi:glycosyltransferase involved in cell wall biosynthesis
MISILIPIYNGIEYIEESVSSVLAQTYENWEIIIGINGHEPNSKVFNIANKYTNISDKIKVIELYPIRGKSNALNSMLNYCKYDWIAILDVDDIWYPNKLELQVRYLENYDIIGTKCEYFQELSGCPTIPTGDISNFDFLSVNPVINSSSIIRKKYCEWNSQHDGVEDYDLWLTLRYIHNAKFFNLNQILVKHRIHRTSSFNNNNQNLVPNLITKYKNLIK